MSGHSKWHNIQNTKGAQDAKRTKLFSKLSNNIYVAAKLGGSSDEKLNPLLKDAIFRAKSFSLSKDKIDNALNRASGNSNKNSNYLEKTYEFYGVGGEAMFIVKCFTDNPNRIHNNIRDIVNKEGGKIVPEGSLAWNFKEYIVMKVSISNEINLQDSILGLFEIKGIDNVSLKSDYIEVLINKSNYSNINNITSLIKKIKLVILSITYELMPSSIIKLDNVALNLNIQLSHKIGELEEVDNIWSNII